MQDWLLAVFPKVETVGWKGDAATTPLSEPYTLADFVAPQTTEACAVGYNIPGEDFTIRRLNKEAWPVLRNGGVDPLVHWAFLDLDRPKHAAWASKDEAAACCELLVDLLLDNCRLPNVAEAAGVYSTRAGVRLMWRLATPLPSKYARAWFAAFYGMLMQQVDVAAVGLEYDSSTDQWSRLMRLPRCKRDGEVLDPYIDLSALEDGETIDPAAMGIDLASLAMDAEVDYGEFEQEEVELTWEQWGAAANLPWVAKGEPIPPNENGSVYEALRTALAKMAYRGDISDPRVLWTMVKASAEASNRDPKDAWDLCVWVAGRQASGQAPDPEPAVENPTLQPRPVTPDEWALVGKVLGRTSTNYARLREGQALDQRSPTSTLSRLLTVMRTLASGGVSDPMLLFSVCEPQVRAGTLGMTAQELWDRCAALDAEYREVRREVEAGQSIKDAFCARHPLFLAAARGTGFYVLDTRHEPYTYRACSSHLAAAGKTLLTNAPFVAQLQDEGRVRSNADLLYDYGDQVLRARYKSGVTGAAFDPQRGLLEMGVHALDPSIEPAFSEAVDTWLRRLVTEEDYPTLEAWLACATFTDEPLACLYLDGPGGCGKSLLAKVLATLWDAAPTEYNRVDEGRFNSELLGCPILMADEGIVVHRGNEAGASERFRNYVSGTRHAIEAKGKDVAELHGALRVVVAANGPDGLPFREALGQEGIEAIASRVIYCRVPGSGAEWRAAFRFESELSARRILAEGPAHLLWLRDNVGRPLLDAPREGRFLVTGHRTAWHDRWALRQGLKPACLEVVATLIRRRAKTPTLLVRRDRQLGQEVVRVAAGEVFDAWADYKDVGRPTRQKVADTLRQLSLTGSSGTVRWTSGTNGARSSGYTLPLSVFVDAGIWASEAEVPTHP